VNGYRRVHLAAHSNGAATGRGGDTEELREALVEARALFETLTSSTATPATAPTAAPTAASTAASARTDRTDPARTARTDDSPRGGRSHLPWALNRRDAKGS
jgi:hypothetical protein